VEKAHVVVVLVLVDNNADRTAISSALEQFRLNVDRSDWVVLLRVAIGKDDSGDAIMTPDAAVSAWAGVRTVLLVRQLPSSTSDLCGVGSKQSDIMVGYSLERYNGLSIGAFFRFDGEILPSCTFTKEKRTCSVLPIDSCFAIVLNRDDPRIQELGYLSSSQRSGSKQ